MDVEVIRPYQLVEFIKKGPKTGRCVDCVPSLWIRYDFSKKRYVTKFMNPPYNDKTIEILYKLVECKMEAPDHWPEYSVKLVGDAQTYSEANEKLILLRTQESVYSSAPEMHAKDKAAAIAKEIKARDSLPDLEEIMKVPDLKKKISGPKKNNPVENTDDDTNLGNDSLSEVELHHDYNNSSFQDSNLNMSPLLNKHDKKINSTILLKSKAGGSKISDKSFENDSLSEEELHHDYTNSSFQDSNLNMSPLLNKHDKKIKSKKGGSKSKRKRETSSECSSSQNDSLQNFKVTDPGTSNRGKTASIAPKKILLRAVNKSKKKNLLRKEKGETISEHSSSENDLSDLEVIDKKTSLMKNGTTSFHTKKNKFTGDKKSSNSGISEKQYQTLLREIRGLKLDAQTIIGNQNTLINMFESVNRDNYVSTQSFCEIHKLDVPFKTIVELKNFDEKLKTDEVICKDFKGSLITSFDKDNILRKTVHNIIRKYLSRDLAIKFTAIKKTNDKELFKEYRMCSCLLEVLSKKHEISEEEVLSHVGSIFNNAKDWDGARKSRGPQLNNNNNNNII